MSHLEQVVRDRRLKLILEGIVRGKRSPADSRRNSLNGRFALLAAASARGGFQSCAISKCPPLSLSSYHHADRPFPFGDGVRKRQIIIEIKILKIFEKF